MITQFLIATTSTTAAAATTTATLEVFFGAKMEKCTIAQFFLSQNRVVERFKDCESSDIASSLKAGIR